jgi:hypothetical protein
MYWPRDGSPQAGAAVPDDTADADAQPDGAEVNAEAPKREEQSPQAAATEETAAAEPIHDNQPANP